MKLVDFKMAGVRNYIRQLGLGMHWLKLRHLVKNPFKFSFRCKTFFLAIKYYFYNSWLTNFPSYRVRTFYLRKFLRISIGEYTAIHMGCFFTGINISIGSNAVVACSCYFDGRLEKSV